eukprot:TRINITY_DN1696_c0_g1_i2.p1 TRINITY_DN1696_c0_g1~~TRINITY_DN1696_c0_g1_i2.p1  ORF type:complete len:249 (-),score=48.20 TRINITY_DN1696_c0_g1_i2:73-819(-)
MLIKRAQIMGKIESLRVIDSTKADYSIPIFPNAGSFAGPIGQFLVWVKRQVPVGTIRQKLPELEKDIRILLEKAKKDHHIEPPSAEITTSTGTSEPASRTQEQIEKEGQEYALRGAVDPKKLAEGRKAETRHYELEKARKYYHVELPSAKITTSATGTSEPASRTQEQIEKEGQEYALRGAVDPKKLAEGRKAETRHYANKRKGTQTMTTKPKEKTQSSTENKRKRSSQKKDSTELASPKKKPRTTKN